MLFAAQRSSRVFHEFVFAWHVFCFAEKLRVELSAEKVHAAVCAVTCKRVTVLRRLRSSVQRLVSARLRCVGSGSSFGRCFGQKLCLWSRRKKSCVAKKNFVWSNSPGTSFTPTRACEKPDAKVWCAKCKAKAEAVAIIYMVAELCGVR